MAIGEAIAGAVEGLFNGGINLYNSMRDFDYQKSVQQEVWNREDNAVQRRVADLKAAGLNPNLAAGSAASAGSVVGRSNTPNQNISAIGNALDFASHVQQLRNEREYQQVLQNQKELTYANSLAAAANSTMDIAQTMYMLGMNPRIRFDKNGKLTTYADAGTYGFIGSPLQNQLKYQLQSNKNSADLLQKDVNWYNAQQIENLIGTTARALGGFGSAYKNFNYQAPSYNTYQNRYSQNYYSNPYIKNNW